LNLRLNIYRFARRQRSHSVTSRFIEWLRSASGLAWTVRCITAAMKRFFACVMLSAGCSMPATVGANSNTTSVPRDSAATCAGYCQSIGLGLDSVVIMANNVGCVCAARGVAPPPPGPGGVPAAPVPTSSTHAGAAGGLTAIVLQQEAARQAAAAQQQRQQQQQQQQQPYPAPRY
jgi:hypothetical protein